MITVEIPQMAQFQTLLKKSPEIVKKELKKGVKDSALIIWAKSAQEAPRKTGKLKMSIKPFFKRLTQLEARIAPTVDYAIYVHEGTRAHEIRPKNAKVLAFKIGGRMVFTKKVNHPGTKPNRFMKRGLEKSRAKLNYVFQLTLERITKQLTTK